MPIHRKNFLRSFPLPQMKINISFFDLGVCFDKYKQTDEDTFFKYKQRFMNAAYNLPHLTLLYLESQEQMATKPEFKPLFQKKIGNFAQRTIYSSTDNGKVTFKSAPLKRFLALHAIASTALYEQTHGLIFVTFVEGMARPLETHMITPVADTLLGQVAEILLDTVPNETWVQIPPSLRVEVYNAAEKIIAEYTDDVRTLGKKDGIVALCLMISDKTLKKSLAEAENPVQAGTISANSVPAIAAPAAPAAPDSTLGSSGSSTTTTTTSSSSSAAASASSTVARPASTSKSSTTTQQAKPSATTQQAKANPTTQQPKSSATTLQPKPNATTQPSKPAAASAPLPSEPAPAPAPPVQRVYNCMSLFTSAATEASNAFYAANPNWNELAFDGDISFSQPHQRDTNSGAAANNGAMMGKKSDFIPVSDPVETFTEFDADIAQIESVYQQQSMQKQPNQNKATSNNTNSLSTSRPATTTALPANTTRPASTSAASSATAASANTNSGTSSAPPRAPPQSNKPADKADNDTTEELMKQVAQIEHAYATQPPTNPWKAPPSSTLAFTAARRCIAALREHMDALLLGNRSRWEEYASLRMAWEERKQRRLSERARFDGLRGYMTRTVGNDADGASGGAVSGAVSDKCKEEAANEQSGGKKRRHSKGVKSEANASAADTLVQLNTDKANAALSSNSASASTALASADGTGGLSPSLTPSPLGPAESDDNDPGISLPQRKRPYSATGGVTVSNDSSLPDATPPQIPLPFPLPLLAENIVDSNSNIANEALNMTKTESGSKQTFALSTFADSKPVAFPPTISTTTPASIPLTPESALVADALGPTVRVMTFNLDSLECEWSWPLPRIDDWRRRGRQKSMPRPQPGNSGSWENVSDNSERTQRHLIIPIRNLYPDITDKKKRAMAAALIYDANPDILCVTEVDTLMTLDAFNRTFLPTLDYTYSCLVELRSASSMNVGLLSRFPIQQYKLHKDASCQVVFPKGVLEVDVDVRGTTLTLYVCHFKAMEKTGANNIIVNEDGVTAVAAPVDKADNNTQQPSGQQNAASANRNRQEKHSNTFQHMHPYMHSKLQQAAMRQQQKTDAVLSHPHTALLSHGVVSEALLDDVGHANELRWLQATHLANIIDQRWGSLGHCGNFVVLGALNDTPSSAYLRPLLGRQEWTDVLARLSSHHRWTHCHFDNKVPRYTQLDYILPSAALASSQYNAARAPVVLRNGLSWKVKGFQGERYAPATSSGAARASDHCPVYMDLTLLRVRAHPAIGGKHIMLSLSESSSNTASTAAVPAPSVVTGMGSGVGEALETGVVESFASLSRLLESQPSDYAIARPRRPHFVPSLQRSRPLLPPMVLPTTGAATLNTVAFGTTVALTPDTANSSSIASALDVLHDYSRTRQAIGLAAQAQAQAARGQRGRGQAGADDDAVCVYRVYGEVRLDEEDEVDSDIEICESLPAVISLDSDEENEQEDAEDEDEDEDDDNNDEPADENADKDVANPNPLSPTNNGQRLKKNSPSRSSSMRKSNPDDIIYIDFGDDEYEQSGARSGNFSNAAAGQPASSWADVVLGKAITPLFSANSQTASQTTQSSSSSSSSSTSDNSTTSATSATTASVSASTIAPTQAATPRSIANRPFHTPVRGSDAAPAPLPRALADAFTHSIGEVSRKRRRTDTEEPERGAVVNEGRSSDGRSGEGENGAQDHVSDERRGGNYRNKIPRLRMHTMEDEQKVSSLANNQATLGSSDVSRTKGENPTSSNEETKEQSDFGLDVNLISAAPPNATESTPTGNAAFHSAPSLKENIASLMSDDSDLECIHMVRGVSARRSAVNRPAAAGSRGLVKRDADDDDDIVLIE